MAVPPSVKFITVSVELTDVCVTVNVALTGPVSAPCVVPAIETVAPLLSVMFRLAVRLAGLAFNVMSGSPLVIAVRVTATVSVGSTTASLITGIVIVAVVLPAGIVTECVMAV